MSKIWVVLCREFVARVRTKWFVIGTALGPLMMAMLVVLPMYMATGGGGHRIIAVLDAGGSGLGQTLTDGLNVEGGRVYAMYSRVEPAALQSVADSLAAAVGDKQLDGFVIVSEETVSSGVGEYRGSNASSQVDMELLRHRFREALLTERLRMVGVDPDVVARARGVNSGLRTVTIRGGEATEDSGAATFALAYVMWFLLYMAILLYGVQVLGAVVEEKASRVVEVLVSSLRPFELLAGKVLGVGAVGLFQLLIWAGAARLLFSQRVSLMNLVGFEMGVGSVVSLPEIRMTVVILFLTYFVLGFLLYAAVFAAVAAMSSTEAEARQAQAPVTMSFAIPAIVAVMAMMTEPDGLLFAVLSMVPFSSPIAMPARWVVSDVAPIDLSISIVTLVLALGFVTWVAGRIFRVGILMYGKRPNVREVWRWVRASG